MYYTSKNQKREVHFVVVVVWSYRSIGCQVILRTRYYYCVTFFSHQQSSGVQANKKIQRGKEPAAARRGVEERECFFTHDRGCNI